uniref:Chromo shadow domain-containing protein n=1 Tax=Glossina pallidipes TaxID=7398 RepID=A0A1B0AIW5_GLOPL
MNGTAHGQLCWLRMANTRENLGIIDMLYAGYESEDQTDMSFIHELQPTEILHAVQEPSGRLLFLIKWRDPHGAHVLDAADAKILWPQLYFQHTIKLNPELIKLRHSVLTNR